MGLGLENIFESWDLNSVLGLENNFVTQITNLVLGLGLEIIFVSCDSNSVLGLENNFVS